MSQPNKDGLNMRPSHVRICEYDIIVTMAASD